MARPREGRLGPGPSIGKKRTPCARARDMDAVGFLTMGLLPAASTIDLHTAHRKVICSHTRHFGFRADETLLRYLLKIHSAAHSAGLMALRPFFRPSC
jgi:hypothetical protein